MEIIVKINLIVVTMLEYFKIKKYKPHRANKNKTGIHMELKVKIKDTGQVDIVTIKAILISRDMKEIQMKININNIIVPLIRN